MKNYDVEVRLTQIVIRRVKAESPEAAVEAVERRGEGRELCDRRRFLPAEYAIACKCEGKSS